MRLPVPQKRTLSNMREREVVIVNDVSQLQVKKLVIPERCDHSYAKKGEYIIMLLVPVSI